jgi:hypothetical protein
LKVASLLGYHFGEEAVLIDVACTAVEEKHTVREASSEILDTLFCCSRAAVVLSLVLQAVKGGFIESTSNGYQFTHDKV